jgi:hypothetical protein
MFCWPSVRRSSSDAVLSVVRIRSMRSDLERAHRAYSDRVTIVDWAESTARAFLADALPRRWVHVQEVASRARGLAAALGEADAVMLHASAWLHDVGYAPKLATTAFHPIDGACWLRAANAPGRLAGLVAFHSAAASEATLLGLDEQMTDFEDERTLVRDLLWYADMTVGPEGECMTFERRMEEVRERYSPDHYVVRALDIGMDERRAAVERAERWIDNVGLTDQV